MTHQDSDVDVFLIGDAREGGAERDGQAVTRFNLDGAALSDQSTSSLDLNLELMRLAVARVDGTVVLV